MSLPTGIPRRVCDECGREWLGFLPAPEDVHIWNCPWCETRLSGRAVVWRQQPDDTWMLVKGESKPIDEWPWNGPLRVVPRSEGGTP